MKKTGLTGYVYNFSVDYDIIPTVSIPHIHKNLTIKNDFKCLFAVFVIINNIRTMINAGVNAKN